MTSLMHTPLAAVLWGSLQKLSQMHREYVGQPTIYVYPLKSQTRASHLFKHPQTSIKTKICFTTCLFQSLNPSLHGLLAYSAAEKKRKETFSCSFQSTTLIRGGRAPRQIVFEWKHTAGKRVHDGKNKAHNGFDSCKKLFHTAVLFAKVLQRWSLHVRTMSVNDGKCQPIHAIQITYN